MSITTTITYVRVDPQGNHVTATTTGSPVTLLQSANGQILHAGEQVKELQSAISGSDSQVTFRIASNGTHNVIVMSVNITSPVPVPTQPDVGGVTWAAADRGQDITFTAPAVVGSQRTYEFDSPPQPPVKLKVTVLRT